MPGSPRVERAANIRIQHPNLSTEDAMKLAGYTEEEARDPKKQSNVRQKTHRLTKGRKRNSTDYISNPEFKRSLTEDANPSRKPGSSTATPSEYFHPVFEYDRNRIQSFEKVSEKISTIDSQAHLQSPERPSTPEMPGGRRLTEMHRSTGSVRAEKAARFWLDNPNLSIENSMKLAGYSEEEFTDKYRQNDIRQTAHIMTVNAARAKEKKGEGLMSTEIRSKLTAIDHKIDEMASRLERTVDIRLQELGARIDEKFDIVNQRLSMINIGGGGASTASSTYDSRHTMARPQQYQQYPFAQSPYQSIQHPAAVMPQMQQGYNMPAGGHLTEGGQLIQGSMAYPTIHTPQQGAPPSSIGPDGKPRHVDSTVQL